MPRRLALFDLDHTLIPFDSSAAWFDHLIGVGVEPREVAADYLDICHRYLRGEAGVEALLGFVAARLARHDPAELDAWRRAFAGRLAARIPAAAHALVERHRAAGELCCVVTATCRFVAEPFARAFGVEHLVASELERVHARFTGRLDGAPCHGDGKPLRVERWAQHLGLAEDALAGACFYSDSASDLPLLERVAEPIAVAPDARLRAHAERHGWRIVERLDQEAG
jgi:HAD superfamily hydrolase (TIGR01490 family)